jgi:hypothetical protein
MFWTGISLLTEYFILEYPWWLNVLNWNILTDWIFYTGISLEAECFEQKYPYWLNILYWNIPAGWTFRIGIFLLTEYFVLECPWSLKCFELEYPYRGSPPRRRSGSGAGDSSFGLEPLRGLPRRTMEGRKEGRKEGKKEGRKEWMKEERNE